ncbi:cytochrome b5-like heme/steroid binding domain-containing protein, partial [Peziza echinospora]
MPSADKKLSYFESVFKDVAIPNQQFTAKELSIHNTKDDLYVAVDGKVLDVTKWQDQHPGGPDILLDYGGQDATDEFRKRHEANVLKAYAPGTVIGTLVPERIKPAG